MKRVLLFSIIFLLMVSSSHAFTKTFFGEDLNPDSTDMTSLVNANDAHTQFFSYLDGVGTEDFESFTVGQTALPATPLVVDFGDAGQATITGSDTSAIQNSVALGRFPVSGTKYFDTNASASGTFTISFNEDIAAFGFYGTDVGDLQGQITVTTAGNSSMSYNIPHTIAAPDGSAIYWAIINTDNPFASITFKNTASVGDWFGFDDFSIGTVSQVRDTPVPLPSSILFLLSGILFLTRRKKRR